MSIGTKTIVRCVQEGATAELRSLDLTLLEEEELPLFEFVRGHLSDHHALPSLDTITQHGYVLPRRAGQEPISYYIQELKRRKVFRGIAEQQPAFREAMETRNLEDAVEALQAMLAGASSTLSPTTFRVLGSLVEEVVSDYHFAKEHPGIRGIPFGYETLDQLTSGAQGGDLIVVAARTGMGKSWFLIAMAYAAWQNGYNVGLASMEMSLLPIARRWMGLHTSINPNLIRAGTLSGLGENRLLSMAEAVAAEGEVQTYFMSGDFGKKVSAIDAMFDECSIEALYIDAAYLLTPEGRSRGHITRWEQIATVIQELKSIALERNKPIIITVQMNRNVKKKTSRVLDTTDVGGSDSIPQDASILLGLRQGLPPFEQVRRIGDLMKNRDGEEASLDFHFRFDPVNLGEAPPIEQEETDISWMED